MKIKELKDLFQIVSIFNINLKKLIVEFKLNHLTYYLMLILVYLNNQYFQ